MRERLGVAALTVLVVTTLAGCSSSGTTSGASGTSTPDVSTSAGSSTATTSTAPAGATGTGTPALAQALFARMQAEAKTIRTEHAQLVVDIGGQLVTSAIDAKIDNSTASALRLVENVPGGGTIEILEVGGKGYVKLASNSAAKPWTLLSKTSKDASIRSIAASIETAATQTSTENYAAFAQAAGSIQLVGTVSIGGVTAQHYSIVVVPSRLPASSPQRAALVASGMASIPVELFLDSAGRVVRLGIASVSSGTPVATTITFSKYNEPLSIVAPPASQVGVA